MHFAMLHVLMVLRLDFDPLLDSYSLRVPITSLGS